MLGALDYVTKKLTTITNDIYITATEVRELIKKVSIEYAKKPIYFGTQQCPLSKMLVGTGIGSGTK